MLMLRRLLNRVVNPLIRLSSIRKGIEIEYTLNKIIYRLRDLKLDNCLAWYNLVLFAAVMFCYIFILPLRFGFTLGRRY